MKRPLDPIDAFVLGICCGAMLTFVLFLLLYELHVG